MAVSRRLRYEILRRDDHACRYCGSSAPDVALTVDHVIPVALGGSDDPTNLATACRDCNAGKSSTTPDAPLVDDVAEDALRWARAMRQAADMQAQEDEARQEYVAAFEKHWNTWHRVPSKEPIPLPIGWEDGVSRFFRLNLEFSTLKESVDIAMRARINGWKDDPEFRYFCGVVNRKLEERQELARKLLDEGLV